MDVQKRMVFLLDKNVRPYLFVSSKLFQTSTCAFRKLGQRNPGGRQGKWREAADDFSRAITMPPDDEEGKFVLFVCPGSRAAIRQRPCDNVSLVLPRGSHECRRPVYSCHPEGPAMHGTADGYSGPSIPAAAGS